MPKTKSVGDISISAGCVLSAVIIRYTKGCLRFRSHFDSCSYRRDGAVQRSADVPPRLFSNPPPRLFPSNYYRANLHLPVTAMCGTQGALLRPETGCCGRYSRRPVFSCRARKESLVAMCHNVHLSSVDLYLLPHFPVPPLSRLREIDVLCTSHRTTLLLSRTRSAEKRTRQGQGNRKSHLFPRTGENDEREEVRHAHYKHASQRALRRGVSFRRRPVLLGHVRDLLPGGHGVLHRFGGYRVRGRPLRHLARLGLPLVGTADNPEERLGKRGPYVRARCFACWWSSLAAVIRLRS